MRKPKKKRKKLISIKKGVMLFFFAAFIAGAVYLFFFSSVFEIKRVEVLGAEKIPEKEIEYMVFSKLGKNIFLADLDNAKNHIINIYPEIARIEAKRKLPDTIFIEIEERKPVAVLNKLYMIDKEGIAFEQSQDNTLLQITGDNNDITLGQKAVERITDILKIAKGVKAKQITVVSDGRLDVMAVEGFDIYFSLEKDIEWQIEQLQALLQEEITAQEKKDIEYIDLRFEKIFVKKTN